MDLKADIPRGTDVVLARCGYDTEKKKEAERLEHIEDLYPGLIAI